MSGFVTINTRDFGLVRVVEPDWCLGQHVDGNHRTDITHVGREICLDVPTPKGPAPLLVVSVEQRPYTQLPSPPGTEVFMSVEIYGDHYPMLPNDLLGLADGLTANVHRVQALAQRLARLREVGG